MTKVMHASHLDIIGGVERLFYNFLSNRKTDLLEHATLALNKKAHPTVSKPLEANKVPIFYSKYFGPIKLPNFLDLRKWHIKKILKEFETEILVYWNCEIFSSQKQCLEIFYDHGASWFIEENSRQYNMLNRVDKIIACSHASKRVLELRWPQKKACIEKVLNPLRPDIHFADSKRTHPLKANKKMRIGSSGRLVPLKGFVCALHAIKELISKGYPVELSIAGTGKDKEALEDYANKLGIASSVTFEGYVEDMTVFYDSIDLFLAPSFREPFGLVALEAQARALPVIANAVDGLVEAVEDKKTAFCIPAEIDPKEFEYGTWKAKNLPKIIYDPTKDILSTPMGADPSKVARAIAKLIDDQSLYEEFSLNALKRSMSDFKFSDYVSKLEAIFLEGAKAT